MEYAIQHEWPGNEAEMAWELSRESGRTAPRNEARMDLGQDRMDLINWNEAEMASKFD